MDGREKGDPIGIEEGGEHPDGKRSRLVDEHDVGIGDRVGGDCGLGEPYPARLTWVLFATGSDGDDVFGFVVVDADAERRTQLQRPDEPLAGVAVAGCRHEDVQPLARETGRSEPRSAGLPPTAVGLDDDDLSAVSQALEGGEGPRLVARSTRLVRRSGERGGDGDRRGRWFGRGTIVDIGPRIASSLARIDVDDGDAGVRSEDVGEPAAKPSGHVGERERRNREAFVEVGATVGPLVERWRQEHEQAATVDDTGEPAEEIRREALVGVADEQVARGPEERVGTVRRDAFETEPLAGRDEGHGVGGDARTGDGIESRVPAGVAVPAQHEEATLVGRRRRGHEVGGERLDHRRIARGRRR